MRMAECHPDKPHYAKGLCESCWRKQNYHKRRKTDADWVEETNKIKRESDRIRRALDPEYVERKRVACRKWRDRNKDDPEWVEKTKQRRIRNNLKTKYDLTVVEYDSMLEAQGGVCWICGKSPRENGQRLAVDHNHVSGENRGLLCNHCNTAIGYVEENLETLQRMIEYLEVYNVHKS